MWRREIVVESLWLMRYVVDGWADYGSNVVLFFFVKGGF